MLRIERTSRSGDVAIRFRAKRRWVSPLFLQALALALAFHLLPLLLFKIQPIYLDTTETPLPPVYVDTDLGEESP